MARVSVIPTALSSLYSATICACSFAATRPSGVVVMFDHQLNELLFAHATSGVWPSRKSWLALMRRRLVWI
jgi:hypothetical protein